MYIVLVWDHSQLFTFHECDISPPAKLCAHANCLLEFHNVLVCDTSQPLESEVNLEHQAYLSKRHLQANLPSTLCNSSIYFNFVTFHTVLLHVAYDVIFRADPRL